MNSEMIAALAAIAGAFVGAFGSVVGTWIAQRHQDRRDLLAKRVARRESLYSDSITESARLLVDGLEHNLRDPQKLIPIYGLLSRIRLSSSSRVLETAEGVVRNLLIRYLQPKLSPEEIHTRAVNGQDPLREFSTICRSELETLLRQL
ncbi:MAG TPA: hypothetical protein VFN26_15025 [Candidatus Acidoferrum sp.]|nr:hypothetical protein [Candidatus Acidoferrum sp.]